MAATLALALLITGCTSSDIDVTLDDEALNWLGTKIYQNECNLERDCLTSWNESEDFPSLGTGHFIWYQAGQEAPFEETFPDLIAFMSNHGAKPPEWINVENPDSPWTSREQFLAEFNSEQMTELRKYLAETLSLQAAFIVDRFEKTLTELTQASELYSAEAIRTRIKTLAQVNPPQGLFAMIDYMHFKGSGLTSTERYNNEGWGLLQVLENMEDTSEPLKAFVASGRYILENRVNNSPPDRNEAQWLRGWFNRMDGYLLEPQY